MFGFSGIFLFKYCTHTYSGFFICEAGTHFCGKKLLIGTTANCLRNFSRLINSSVVRSSPKNLGKNLENLSESFFSAEEKERRRLPPLLPRNSMNLNSLPKDVLVWQIPGTPAQVFFPFPLPVVLREITRVLFSRKGVRCLGKHFLASHSLCRRRKRC